MEGGPVLHLASGEADLDRREVRRAGAVVRLTPLEARLLGALAHQPNVTLSPAQLLTQVWGYRGGVRTRTVTVTVERLRRKVEIDPSRPVHVLTVAGGYAFAPLPEVAPSRDFVGRDEPLRELLALARAGRSVVVSGPGGVGKSRLVTEAARVLVAEGHPVESVELEEVRTADEALGRVAVALGLRGGAEVLVPALRRRAPMLLILDDLDLLEDAAGLAPLVDVPRVSVVLTSRHRLGLDHTQELQLDRLGESASRELLRARGVAAGASAERLTEARLATLVEALDGLPLAIVLAAAWLPWMNPGHLAERAAELVDRAGGESRHASLAACVERSWSALNDGEKRDLALLCTLPGPLPLGLCEELIAGGQATLARLARLERHSAITLAPEGRVRVPASIRDHVARSAPREAVGRRRATAWAAGRVARAVGAIGTASHAMVLEEAERDLTLLGAALDLADPAAAGSVLDLVAVAGSLGLDHGSQARLQKVLDQTDEPGTQARALLLRAQLGGRHGRDPRSDLAAAEAAAEAARRQDLVVEVRIALAAAKRGQADSSDAWLRGTLDGPLSDQQRGRCLYELGVSARRRGEPERAAELAREVVALGRRSDLPRIELLGNSLLGAAERARHRHVEAEAATRQALRLALDLREYENAAHLRCNLANVCVFDGRPAEAARLVRDALAHYGRQGHLRSIGYALQTLAVAQIGLGRAADAMGTAVEAREAFHTAGSAQGEAYCLCLVARLLHHAGRPAEAVARYREGIALLHAHPLDAGRFGLLAAAAAADTGDRDLARSLREEAGSLLTAHPDASSLLAWADRHLEALDAERADARLAVRAEIADLSLPQLW